MRFNHMELTFPPGGLDETTRRDIAAFYGEMFGWAGTDVVLLHGLMAHGGFFDSRGDVKLEAAFRCSQDFPP